jgi:hypothetical protein
VAIEGQTKTDAFASDGARSYHSPVNIHVVRGFMRPRALLWYVPLKTIFLAGARLDRIFAGLSTGLVIIPNHIAHVKTFCR